MTSFAFLMDFPFLGEANFLPSVMCYTGPVFSFENACIDLRLLGDCGSLVI
jgi:hypothetical protein